MSVKRGKSRKQGRARGTAYYHGRTWWLRYSVRGQRVRVNTGLRDPGAREQAEDMLTKKLAEVDLGLSPAIAGRVGFEEMVGLIRADYRNKSRKSWSTAERSIAHLRLAFERYQASEIPNRVDAYIAARLEAGAKPATVRKEVAALRRMFALAVRKGRIAARPDFTNLEVKNTRTQSFTPDEFDAVLDVLTDGRTATELEPEVKKHPELVPLVRFAAWTGWRKSNLLALTWRQVDFNAGTVWLERHTTKSDEPVVFPFRVVPELEHVLLEQREATSALGKIVPWVFHRNGQPIRRMDDAWRAALRAAGLPGRRFHDLRRTAARRLRGLGMSDRDIAELCGWETIEMVTRYLGRDPAGVADRLRIKVAEAQERAQKGQAMNG
jgi:integrase